MSENYCVIYCRVSTGKQKEKGVSLEVQEDMLKEYADEHGFKVVKKWVVKEPATKPGRKAFNQMIRYIKDNNIKHVLVENTDRLQRNKRDETLIEELIEEGKAFHLVGEDEILAVDVDEMKQTMQELKGVMARAEIRRMKKRTSQAVKKRLERGERVSLAPLGYINLPPSKHTKERYRKIEEVAEKVKKLLEMYSSGRFTVMEMCDIARKMGLQSKQGMEIKYSAMRYLLTNRFYCGLWKHKNKDRKVLYSGTSEGQWEPIVGKDLIEKNIKILNDQTAPSKKRRGYDFRFKGLMTCSVCGRSLIGEVGGRTEWKLKTGKIKSYTKTYYHCHRSPYKDPKTKQKVKCPAPFFPEDFVEGQILWNLGLLEFDEKVWNETKMQLFDFEAKDILEEEKKALRSELTRLERRLNYLLDEKLDPEKEITEDYYQSQKSEWEKRVFEIRAELEALDMQLDNWHENVGKMIELVDNLKDFKKKWVEFTPMKGDTKEVQEKKKEKQRHMLNLITKKIIAKSYTGPLLKAKLKGKKKPVVDKKDSMSLEFVWSEEFQILFELGFIKKVDNLSSVDNKGNPSDSGEGMKKKRKKSKLSTIQQKLDFLFSIIYLLFIS